MFVHIIFLMISDSLSKPFIELVAKIPKGCGSSYITKKKILNTLVQELSKSDIHAEYTIESSPNISEFNLFVKDRQGELILLGTSESQDLLFLPYLFSTESGKENFIKTVIERLNKYKII